MSGADRPILWITTPFPVLNSPAMNLAQLTEGFREHTASVAPFGKSIKFAFEEGCIHLDGTGDSIVVSNEDREADCTIRTRLKHFDRLRRGELNPMTALMTGKIRIQGDMGLAMKLRDLLGPVSGRT